MDKNNRKKDTSKFITGTIYLVFLMGAMNLGFTALILAEYLGQDRAATYESYNKSAAMHADQVKADIMNNKEVKDVSLDNTPEHIPFEDFTEEDAELYVGRVVRKSLFQSATWILGLPFFIIALIYYKKYSWIPEETLKYREAVNGDYDKFGGRVKMFIDLVMSKKIPFYYISHQVNGYEVRREPDAGMNIAMVFIFKFVLPLMIVAIGVMLTIMLFPYMIHRAYYTNYLYPEKELELWKKRYDKMLKEQAA